MITVTHLTKNYGAHTAVDDISFEIDEGHIYGFLGPNGAGKSTTLNILTGCLSATAGEITIDGHDIYQEAKAAKKNIGYLPEIPPLYMEQTPYEYLEFVAMAKGLKAPDLYEAIEKAVEETHIEEVADKLIRNLSKGYRQRVGIAQALLGDPKIIILDEPTVGLDPMQIIEIRELILELGKTHTVILSSHILSEIQTICDQVMIIYKGKIAAFDTMEHLNSSRYQEEGIEILTEAPMEMIPDILYEICTEGSYQITKEAEGCRVVINQMDFDTKEFRKKLFTAFANADQAILSMNTKKATLEEIFLELTNAEEQASAAAPANEAAEKQGFSPASEKTEEPVKPAGEEGNDESSTEA